VAVNVYAASSGIVALAGTFAIAGARVRLGHGQRDRRIRVRDAVRDAHRERIRPGPCASVGVQANAPVLALMLAPLGAPTSENVSGCAGTSLSVAVAVNVYAESSGIVALAGTFAITGAAFTSVTVSVIAASVFAVPSLTRTRERIVARPLRLGRRPRERARARVDAGTRRAPDQRERQRLRRQVASVAVAVNVYAASSGIVALAGTFAIAGAVFVSVTVSVIAASVFATPSLTRTLNG
jgi:hypothetical protein